MGVAKDASVEVSESKETTAKEGDKMEVDAKSEEKGEKKVTIVGGKGEKKKDEPDFQMIANPARVLPQQVSGRVET